MSISQGLSKYCSLVDSLSDSSEDLHEEVEGAASMYDFGQELHAVHHTSHYMITSSHEETSTYANYISVCLFVFYVWEDARTCIY